MLIFVDNKMPLLFAIYCDRILSNDLS